MRFFLPLILTLSLLNIACGQRSSVGDVCDDKDVHLTVVSGAKTLLTDSLRRDIAEMLIVGFRGQRLGDCKHIQRDIERYHIGGVILFEYDAPTGTHNRNVSSPKQLTSLCHDLQSLTSETLFIGIDQEGGRVNRLREDKGFPRFMSAKKSAQYGDDSIRHYAALTAAQLKRVGVNLNFAPCVDVDINPDCPVIGKLERSFSKSPKIVANAARIWIEEQRKKGVVSCLKHFPGHGSATGDTHVGLVDVTETWKPSELQPYETLITEGVVDMVMTAHVINAKLDKEYPSSLSYSITTKLLRDSLGYDGVVITDDMAMGAIVNEYGFEEAIRLAIEAGADLLCLSNNGKEYNPEVVPQTIAIVEKLVADGKVKADRIHASADRIRSLKAKIK